MRIDVLKSPELLATIYALKSVDATLARKVADYTRAVAGPEWREAVTERAKTVAERRVIADTAMVLVGSRNVRVQAASRGAALSGGLIPAKNYAAVEFGAARKKGTYTRRSQKGRTHKVTRMLGTGLPARRKKGPFYNAADEMVPRIASLWVQTTVKTIGNALEGKQE